MMTSEIYLFNEIYLTCFKIRLILEAAFGHNGVVISNDQYRDLLHIQKFKDIIINR